MIRTSIIAGLFALMASSTWAQTDATRSVPNLDPGSSGGTAGLISGGGTVSSNFDGRDARPSPEARTNPQRAKAEASAKDESVASKARAKAVRARAEASNDDDSGKSERTKKAKKQRPAYGYPYIFGFGVFGNNYSRSRD